MSVWDSIIGQDRAVEQLARAAADACRLIEGTDEVTTMTHSWLITGPPGSGRSNVARAFAAALECRGETPGCGECDGCRSTLARSHPDVTDFVTEKVVITIDEVRQLVQASQTSPANGRWRIILVEDCDRMVERTSNVLLKAIEEPPERTVWLLCAPSPEDLLTTIRSRCRHVSLRVPGVEAVARLLVNSCGIDSDQARRYAAMAQCHIGRAQGLATSTSAREVYRTVIDTALGIRSVRDAVMAAEAILDLEKGEAAALDQVFADEEEKLRTDLGLGEAKRVTGEANAPIKDLREAQKRRSSRFERDFIDRAMLDMLGLYRDVLMIQLGAGVEPISVDAVDAVRDLASSTTPENTLRVIDAMRTARTRLDANVAPLLALEAMMVAMVRNR